MTSPDLVILTDADNTLWDTDAVFARAQLELLEELERTLRTTAATPDRLDYVRSYDQALARIHHAHLKYPPSLLCRAIAVGLHGVNPIDAAKAVIDGRPVEPRLPQEVIDKAVKGFLNALSAPPKPLDSVTEGLTLAKAEGIPVYVLTEGQAERQRTLLREFGFSALVVGVTEATKDEKQFKRLAFRYQPARVVMIGDQPDRDIAPARTAGCVGILVPSRFRPKWHQKHDWQTADYVAQNFYDAVSWAAKEARGPMQPHSAAFGSTPL